MPGWRVGALADFGGKQHPVLYHWQASSHQNILGAITQISFVNTWQSAAGRGEGLEYRVPSVKPFWSHWGRQRNRS